MASRACMQKRHHEKPKLYLRTDRQTDTRKYTNANQVDRMDPRWACLTLFLVLLVDTARGKGCGLSAFRHVPGTHCRGYELVVDRPEVGSVLACAKACCDNPACKSFQYSTYGDCYLISKICTDEEKVTVSIGNMYDRIQGAWRDDLRCGARYPAPNGQSAICNPDGKYPCCAPSGWCGKTTAHCSCSRCVDYRKASKRMVEARETLQNLRNVLLDLEEAAEIEQETRELEDMEEDVDMAEDAEKEMRELEEIEEDAGMAAEDDE
uniref:Apple domain-containing protein n=1 Tax=Branchiostoma floridae TaxID=7739 RepID=C3ZGD7_BRAFL|eukprot:XP_002592370.1 hypothetical protein BRAFLDRAFT_106230 [Branchiostoma floridae]